MQLSTNLRDVSYCLEKALVVVVEAFSVNIKTSRRFVDSSIIGVINALGNTMGFVAPMIVGVLINGHNDVAHWQVVNSFRWRLPSTS